MDDIEIYALLRELVGCRCEAWTPEKVFGEWVAPSVHHLRCHLNPDAQRVRKDKDVAEA